VEAVQRQLKAAQAKVKAQLKEHRATVLQLKQAALRQGKEAAAAQCAALKEASTVHRLAIKEAADAHRVALKEAAGRSSKQQERAVEAAEAQSNVMLELSAELKAAKDDKEVGSAIAAARMLAAEQALVEARAQGKCAWDMLQSLLPALVRGQAPIAVPVPLAASPSAPSDLDQLDRFARILKRFQAPPSP
jgi:hypothetical protein